METVWINILNIFFTGALAVLGLLWREMNKKVSHMVSRELCQERSDWITQQLEHQEQILLRTEQRLIRIEKKMAYQNGEAGNEFDHY